jgi:hypothetical protein
VLVAIVSIPEGLPIALTAGLTITANPKRRNKISCKSLRIVETLGAVFVTYFNKTSKGSYCLIPNLENRNTDINHRIKLEDEMSKEDTTPLLGFRVAELFKPCGQANTLYKLAIYTIVNGLMAGLWWSSFRATPLMKEESHHT